MQTSPSHLASLGTARVAVFVDKISHHVERLDVTALEGKIEVELTVRQVL